MHRMASIRCRCEISDLRISVLPDPSFRAVERSDWFGGPNGAVAIARHHPVAILFGRTAPRRLRFPGGPELLEPIYVMVSASPL